MPSPKKDNLSNDINYLLERADLLLKKKKKELKGCKKCKKIKPLWAVGKCKECFYEDRKPKESQNEGKIWESTDGFMKIYVKNAEGKLVVENLHRKVVSDSLNRKLLRSEKVIFKDGNKTNCDLLNLLLVSDEAINLSEVICLHCGALARMPLDP